MMEQMARAYGVEYKTALTGFKWIGKMIKDFPNSKFIGGGEESFGYMVGDFVRDKDAVTSTLLACEIAASAKANGSSFYKELIDCYVQFGFYKEKLISITKKGMSGAEEIKQMLKDFKENPVDSVQGSKVVWIEDYNTSIAKNVQNGEERTIHLPKSNVLIYETEDGTRIAARPSGTEPKVKFYISTNAKLEKSEDYKSVNSQLDAKIEGILSELNM
jgi:phosphoglucomutase